MLETVLNKAHQKLYQLERELAREKYKIFAFKLKNSTIRSSCRSSSVQSNDGIMTEDSSVDSKLFASKQF